ncbi:MAG TPA: hypothetical protein VLL52_23345 [Anaerolineae bacterium]|nr:hypothetical protein [Anaerolineae bacterium]
MTIVVEFPPDIEKQVQAAAAQTGLSLDGYIQQIILNHLAQKNEASLDSEDDEASLLAQVNLGVSSELWQKYYRLVEKRQDESITSEELTNLIGLTDMLEQANINRMQALIKLAKLRQVSLEDLMTQLNIQPE